MLGDRSVGGINQGQSFLMSRHYIMRACILLSMTDLPSDNGVIKARIDTAMGNPCGPQSMWSMYCRPISSGSAFYELMTTLWSKRPAAPPLLGLWTQR